MGLGDKRLMIKDMLANKIQTGLGVAWVQEELDMRETGTGER